MGKSKIKTPDWILQGSSPRTETRKKSKTFKIKFCPACGSDDVSVILGNEEGKPLTQNKWQCKKCKWKGKNINEKELNEEKFIEYLNRKKL